jgi:hypothetical protein
MVVFVRQEPALSMMFSVYVTLGIFLLLAGRDHGMVQLGSRRPYGDAGPGQT